MNGENASSLILDRIWSFCLAVAASETNGADCARCRQLVVLKDGREKLVCKRLDEARTNASYKVWCEGREDLALFAKQSFTRALWQLDRSVVFDIQRTENEAIAIRKAAKLLDQNPTGAQCPVVCSCVDIPEASSKLLITEWINDTVNFAKQFLDGKVDESVCQTVGRSIALFNLSTVSDPYFNDGIRPMMRSCWPAVKQLFQKCLENNAEYDRCQRLMTTIGSEAFGTFMDKVDQIYMEREVFSHGDAHVFNMLIEAKPQTQSSTPTMVFFCDFEMSFVGPKGRDTGFFQGFPLACALCHAACGSKEKTENILAAIQSFWLAFEECLAREKDQDYIRETYRNTLTWTGVCLFPTYYLMHLFKDIWPLGDASPSRNRKEAVVSMGVLGLKVMQLGLVSDPDLTLKDLQAEFNDAIAVEVQFLLSLNLVKSPVVGA